MPEPSHSNGIRAARLCRKTVKLARAELGLLSAVNRQSRMCSYAKWRALLSITALLSDRMLIEHSEGAIQGRVVTNGRTDCSYK